ncbi:hypothetical protein [Clostridium oceanicum]|uniref:Lipoprotein n=1 Tax=Clostridium oceanicum TaxID=1543 RepID=A0ABP3URJ6_9CLOT
MKRNGCFIIKKIVSIFIIFISITTFFGCTKGKSIVLQDDVKKISKFFKTNIKVDEKFIYITKNNKGRWFEPSFWKNDKLFGTLTYSPERLKELGMEKYTPKYFHVLDVNKKLLKETRNNAFAFVHDGLKEISPLPLEKRNLYYNDFSKEKSRHIFLGKMNDFRNPLDKSSFGPITMVDGNYNFGCVYGYGDSKKMGDIKIIDLKTKKIYKNNNIGNVEIIKVLYVKALKKFMTIDKKGICYEIMFKGNSLELKEYSQIDMGDLSFEVPYYSVLGKCNDSEIYFISRNKIGKNKFIKKRLIKYDFKTKKTDFILNTNKNDNTRVLDYFPKQNILILEKASISKKNGMKKQCSDIYLAEIKKDKVNIFYKSKYKNQVNKYSESLFKELSNKSKKENFSENHEKNSDNQIRAYINDKGDKLAIMRDISIIEDSVFRISDNQVIDYYDIKRD